ncbi:MAG: glycosyltransferase family 8 protein [Cyanobacteria bacterium RUI128]|nr:glycosyltransferase family 8 protein [Cyanobacteria bacterium RUI128]
MDNQVINVCLACDDNYAKYAGVVIASALANSNIDDRLAFYILDGGISEEHKSQINELKSIKQCDINFVNIDESLFDEFKTIKTHSYITIVTYYRLKLPSLLPNIDKIIYFDCDFVVNHSLKDLFETDIEGFYLAGANDIKEKMVKQNPSYVNAGMLLFNLKAMREDNIEEKLFEWTREHIDTIKTGDQEILNEALKGSIKVVDEEWNVQSSNFTNRSSYTHNPKAIHYVAKKKPWHYGSFSIHRDLYFKYLQLTPWKLSDKDYKHWTRDNQIYSLFKYVQYRPLFLFRPKFYKALYYTYLKK